MISIIICSRRPSISKEFKDNIISTIGCENELIVIDNSENKYSIFQAYNKGIKESKFGILCFIHDDILFLSNEWGNKLKNIFSQDAQIGLIGVAGTKVKTKMPSGWWNCPDEFKEINIIQHLNTGKIEKWEYGFKNTNFSRVVSIDGVFIGMKKECNFFFNESIKGFHNYDLNISFECVQKGYKIIATKEILIEHYSNGTINDSWYKSAYKIHQLYKKILPLITDDIKKYNISELEFKNGSAFLPPLINSGNLITSFKIWVELFKLKPMKMFQFKYLKSIIKVFFK